jgi:hypothetical protein
MAGELLIPALDELNAARTLGLESQAILREAAASPLARRDLGRSVGCSRASFAIRSLSCACFSHPARWTW